MAGVGGIEITFAPGADPFAHESPWISSFVRLTLVRVCQREIGPV
jgi:hypothetical protein